MLRKRSTRAEIVEREDRQARIVAELVGLGATDVAAQVCRCWSARLFDSTARRRYRCRSVACLTCRRPSIAGWWRAFVRFAEGGGAVSYFRLPVDCPDETAAIAKSLRNLRDRLARESWLFDDLSFLGLCDGDHAHVLVSHPRMSRQQIGEQLRGLWSALALGDVPLDLGIELSPRVLALIGARRRALQPVRFVVSPRGC